MSASVWTDDKVLMALDLRAAGRSVGHIAGRMGCTSNAVACMLAKFNRDNDGIADLCQRPGNRDGGMPALWWMDGLARQYQGKRHAR